MFRRIVVDGTYFFNIDTEMMKALALFLCTAAALPLYAIDFEGLSAKAVTIEADASTGLDGGIFVLPSVAGVQALYKAQGTGEVKCYRFSNLGGAYAEEIASNRNGNEVRFALSTTDMGYIIEDAGRRTCLWVIDYSAHELELGTLAPAAEQECGLVNLDFTGNASEIPYYTINGRRMVLSRELELSYTTLVFDETAFAYSTAPKSVTIASIGSQLHTTAPLCSTSFTLTGDRFLRAWGREQSIESASLSPITVEAHVRATQAERDIDNEQKDGSLDGLGGSAPCDIAFEAAVTDAAIFTEWQISRSPDFGIPDNSFSDLMLDYTFREQGSTYVRFVANNAEGTCEYVSDTFEIFIGESKLAIPNAFSPEASPGVNDEWKVSYRSLVSYECHIFNRWGTQMFSSTDPAQGWDGKYAGKYVPSGVYYYVIKAEGADGVRYDKAGDINIIKYDQGSAPGTETTE